MGNKGNLSLIAAERYRTAYDLRQQGLTYKQIAAQLGIHKTNAHRLVLMFERRSAQGHPLYKAQKP